MSFIFTKYVLKNLYHLYLYDDFLTCAFVSNSNMDQWRKWSTSAGCERMFNKQ